jgi:predicted nucleic acid-binding protein
MRLIFTEDQDNGIYAQDKKLEELGNPSYMCSDLARLEVLSALRSRRRNHQLSFPKLTLLLAKWDRLKQRRIIFFPFDDEVLELALDIMTNSKIQCRLRSLDCIQFASFLLLRRRHSNAIFFTADFALCSLAIEHSVAFFNPLSTKA